MEVINLDYFKKLDIRVAEIIEAERVPETEKLLKLTINIGDEQRIIVSGVGNEYQTEQLVGKQIIILANLEPKTFRGIESKGMLLAAVNQNGNVSLLMPDKKIVPGDKIS